MSDMNRREALTLLALTPLAATARAGLVRETTIHAAADLTGESRARFGATVIMMWARIWPRSASLPIRTV